MMRARIIGALIGASLALIFVPIAIGVFGP